MEEERKDQQDVDTDDSMRPSSKSHTLPSPLANLSRETVFDGRDGTTRSARVAGDKVETILSLVEFGIGRTASLARYVFHDISSQDILNLFLLETTLDDQSSASVDGSIGPQFGKEELNHMFIRPLHATANLVEIGKDGLLVAFTETLRGRNLVVLASGTGQIRMVGMQHGEES